MVEEPLKQEEPPREFCDHCHSEDLSIDDYTQICNDCGIEKQICIDCGVEKQILSLGLNSTDRVYTSIKYTEQRILHFKEYIKAFQGEHYAKITPALLEKVRIKLKEDPQKMMC